MIILCFLSGAIEFVRGCNGEGLVHFQCAADVWSKAESDYKLTRLYRDTIAARKALALDLYGGSSTNTLEMSIRSNSVESCIAQLFMSLKSPQTSEEFDLILLRNAYTTHPLDPRVSWIIYDYYRLLQPGSAIVDGWLLNTNHLVGAWVPLIRDLRGKPGDRSIPVGILSVWKFLTEIKNSD
jgi:hypothetical protein